MTLHPNAALARLQAGELALGFGLYHLRSVAAATIAARCGYHWLSIDAEHGAFSLAEISDLCAAALTAGIAPIVRVSQRALDEATRALDNGAQGIIVPMVESAEQARTIVEALRFAPVGRRGWGGGAARFGFTPPPLAEAIPAVERETLIIAMIETRAGLAAADAIAAVEGIDMLFVGVSDLSLSLGCPGRFDAPEISDAFAGIAAATQRHGKLLGMGGVYDDVITPRFLAMGARFVAGGSDQGFLMSAAIERARFLEKLAG